VGSGPRRHVRSPLDIAFAMRGYVDCATYSVRLEIHSFLLVRELLQLRGRLGRFRNAFCVQVLLGPWRSACAHSAGSTSNPELEKSCGIRIPRTFYPDSLPDLEPELESAVAKSRYCVREVGPAGLSIDRRGWLET
jgi:hypothetical protein